MENMNQELKSNNMDAKEVQVEEVVMEEVFENVEEIVTASWTGCSNCC